VSGSSRVITYFVGPRGIGTLYAIAKTAVEKLLVFKRANDEEFSGQRNKINSRSPIRGG
jgi:hypothetical protein